MKVLITTGCSFSEPPLWPYHLEKRIPNLSYKNYGKSGMGNEYISRTVFHSVTELLKSGMESKEILVMCCWTAFDRLQNSFSEDKLYAHKLYLPGFGGVFGFPVIILPVLSGPLSCPIDILNLFILLVQKCFFLIT